MRRVAPTFALLLVPAHAEADSSATSFLLDAYILVVIACAAAAAYWKRKLFGRRAGGERLMWVASAEFVLGAAVLVGFPMSLSPVVLALFAIISVIAHVVLLRPKTIEQAVGPPFIFPLLVLYSAIVTSLVIACLH